MILLLNCFEYSIEDASYLMDAKSYPKACGKSRDKNRDADVTL